MKIRHNHPDLKGSFTCLGNWYNVLDNESMDLLSKEILNSKKVSPADKRMAQREISEAKDAALVWEPVPHMMWFYRKYAVQNIGNKNKMLKVNFLGEK